MTSFARPGPLGILTAACLALASCGPAPTRTDSAQGDDRTLIPGGNYVLVGMDGGAVPLRNVTLRVEETRLSGNGPCNGYSVDNNAALPSLVLSPIITSQATCKDIGLENRYLSVLQSASLMEFYGGVLKVKSPSTWLIFERGVRADSAVNALDAARGRQ